MKIGDLTIIKVFIFIQIQFLYEQFLLKHLICRLTLYTTFNTNQWFLEICGWNLEGKSLVISYSDHSQPFVSVRNLIKHRKGREAVHYKWKWLIKTYILHLHTTTNKSSTTNFASPNSCSNSWHLGRLWQSNISTSSNLYCLQSTVLLYCQWYICMILTKLFYTKKLL